jgi:transaldolase
MATQDAPLQALAEAGVAVWLDDLSRDLVQGGGLAAWAERGVVGVTTNPSIFAAALSHGSAYDEQLATLAARGATPDEAAFALTTDDVRDACDVLREVYDATDGVDGRVSIEVDPRLAHDTDGTIAAARSLWATIDRPNLFVKIPATVEGLPAISAVLAEGISVNVTLIFSLDRYRAVIDAFASGLEGAQRAGIDLRGIGSVASFFVSRVDTAVDHLIDGLDTRRAAALRGRAAIANARLAWAQHSRFVGGPRWLALAALGARPQRPLWASTGVKDPSYPDTRYVDDLVVRGVVNTMPTATLEAVADHGVVRTDAVTAHLDDAAAVLAGLEAVGVDLAEVTERLESEGVEKFVTAWSELLDDVGEGLRRTSGPAGATGAGR